MGFHCSVQSLFFTPYVPHFTRPSSFHDWVSFRNLNASHEPVRRLDRLERSSTQVYLSSKPIHDSYFVDCLLRPPGFPDGCRDVALMADSTLLVIVSQFIPFDGLFCLSFSGLCWWCHHQIHNSMKNLGYICKSYSLKLNLLRHSATC